MIWRVPRIWDNTACWVIGGGTSIPRMFGIPIEVSHKVYEGRLPVTAYSPYMQEIHPAHVIGVNNAYQLGPWIDVLFFGDNTWYLVHRNVLYTWTGLKVCSADKFANRSADKMEGVKYLERDKDHREGLSTNPSKVAWNKHSGGAAINLACHFGAQKIFLLGFDMRMDDKAEYSHWHGSHSPPRIKPKRVPPFHKHLKGYPQMAEDAKKMGIEIYNVNDCSKIDVFPMITVQEALEIVRTTKVTEMA